MLTIFCGPAHSGKTERLLARYRAALMQEPPGSALWLAPTWRAAAEIRLRLFDGEFCGCFSPGVMTFEKFAETTLHAAGLTIRPITRLMKRELVRQIIGEQAARGRLRHFQSIAATGGLVDLVCEFISELKRLEIWPDEFHRACAARGIADKDVELSEIYDAYQEALREHGLFDAEGRFWSARDVLRKAEGGRRKAEDAANQGQQTLGCSGVSPVSTNESPSVSAFDPPPSAFPSLVVLDGFTDFTRTQHEIIETSRAACDGDDHHASAGTGAAANRSVCQAAEDAGGAASSPCRSGGGGRFPSSNKSSGRQWGTWNGRCSQIRGGRRAEQRRKAEGGGRTATMNAE